MNDELPKLEGYVRQSELNVIIQSRLARFKANIHHDTMVSINNRLDRLQEQLTDIENQL